MSKGSVQKTYLKVTDAFSGYHKVLTGRVPGTLLLCGLHMGLLLAFREFGTDVCLAPTMQNVSLSHLCAAPSYSLWIPDATISGESGLCSGNVRMVGL